MLYSKPSSTDSPMHNILMALVPKSSTMLGPGDILSGISRFLRYLDTKSNGEYLRKCIFDGPYLPTNVLIAAVEAAENILPVAAHEEVETIHNMTAENTNLTFQAEKKLFFLISDWHCTSKTNAPSIQAISSTRSTATPDTKVKNRQTSYSTILIQYSEEDRPRTPRRDKDSKKNIALLASILRSLYKPTNNNLELLQTPRTRLKMTIIPRQFGIRGTVTVAGLGKH
ncbi:hypothetical protein Tco_0993272 [Tanacetum coccineum]|uniref:Uncharacterized protein n=1 Tax=Tanacetum coccineum TaxID=301880 RepID=A0ABQ5F553_9ASTR